NASGVRRAESARTTAMSRLASHGRPAWSAVAASATSESARAAGRPVAGRRGDGARTGAMVNARATQTGGSGSIRIRMEEEVGRPANPAPWRTIQHARERRGDGCGAGAAGPMALGGAVLQDALTRRGGGRWGQGAGQRRPRQAGPRAPGGRRGAGAAGALRVRGGGAGARGPARPRLGGGRAVRGTPREP